MRVWAIAALGSVFLVTSADAMQGRCSQPQPPYVTLRQPELPICVRLGRGCTSLDRYSWESQVRDYQGRLRDYADEVERFYQDAQTYIRCMGRVEGL